MRFFALVDLFFDVCTGEPSCAECRRVKLRCDTHVVPVHEEDVKASVLVVSSISYPVPTLSTLSCEVSSQQVKASCMMLYHLSCICMTTFRFILADTDQSHKKIAEMSHRISQLEDALAILQSTVSDQ